MGSDSRSRTFQSIIEWKSIGKTFGTEKAEWHWQNGGIITLKAGENKIELQDLTGFDGRCDAVSSLRI